MGAKHSRRWARWVAVALGLALLVGGAGAGRAAAAGPSAVRGPAVADRGDHGRHDEAKKRFTEVTGFTDLDEGDAWAIPYITQLYVHGLVKGEGHGRFNPKASIGQAEAVTLVVRAIEGGDDAALADAQAIAGGGASAQADWLAAHTDWNVKSISHAAGWSLPYLVVAVSKGLLDTGADFRPNQAASRIWSTVLLVRGEIALGLLTEADVTGADLSLLSRFRDLAGLDADERLYLAAGLAAGLVDGYPDGTFRPQAAISRAEFTALVTRALGEVSSVTHVVKGTVTAVDPSQRTISVSLAPARGGQGTVSGSAYATYAVRDDVLIYAKVGGRFVSGPDETLPLSSVQVGDRVTLHLDAQDRVAIIYDEYDLESVEGVVTSVSVPSDPNAPYAFDLRTPDGATRHFQVAFYASVYLDGQPASMSVVVEGAQATVQYHGAEAVTIRVTRLPSGSASESGGGTGEQHGAVTLTGTVRDVAGANAFTMTVELVDNGVVHVEIVYAVTTDADTEFVHIDGVGDLERGDEVTVSGTADGYQIDASRVERVTQD